VRKTILAVLLVATAVVVQLSVINGLNLPGGGVPDLVLVVVAALALADGPISGMIIGFAAGLCLDIAPPASQLIGQYALVFCLAGWAAGRLGMLATRSAFRSTALLAVVIALGEALVAALALALQPGQVSIAVLRLVLPSSIAYDLLILPFVVYLVLALGALLEEGLTGAAGVRSALTVPMTGQSASHQGSTKGRAREPRLAPAAGRPGDGWVGSAPHSAIGYYGQARRPAGHRVRLRPGNGVAGSAAGVARRPGALVPSVNLRLADGRRGDGFIGSAVGGALAPHLRQPGRHPGQLARSGHGFRPQAGQLGGSASGQAVLRPAGLSPGRAPIRFGGRRRDATVGRALGHTGLGDPQRATFVPSPRFSVRAPAAPKMRFSTRRAKTAGRRQPAEPKFRRAIGNSLATPAPVRRHAASPRFRLGSGKSLATSASTRRQAAEPRFRRGTGGSLASPSSAHVAGGMLDQATFRAIRSRRGMPRVRFRARRGSGLIGGSKSLMSGGHAAHTARPRFKGSPAKRRPGSAAKHPKFGYGKRSLLSFLAHSPVGGRWLATRRIGSRSGVWVVSRRTGGAR
jgi:rod shape-determining protein MreD